MKSRAGILLALLPLLGVGCATTALLNAVSDPPAAEYHFGPIEYAYRTASNELVICMMEDVPGSEFNRPFRMQFPLGRCESATNTVIVPRRLLRKNWPASAAGLTTIPVAAAGVNYDDPLA